MMLVSDILMTFSLDKYEAKKDRGWFEFHLIFSEL